MPFTDYQEKARPNSWVIFPKPNPQARMRLFCFPYAGGGTAVYRFWSDGLPPHVELCLIQLPGRESRWREPPFTQLSPVVQTVAQALRPYLNMPFAFFGHSMGALISFELVREIRRQHSSRPAHLFVSGRQAPHIPDTNPPIHRWPEDEFVEEILRRYGGIPKVVRQDVEMMQFMLPVLRADMSICRSHVYTDEHPLDCPISAFGGLQDFTTKQEELAAWRDQTRSSFTLRMFPGNHFFIESGRAQLLQAVSQELRRLLGHFPAA